MNGINRDTIDGISLKRFKSYGISNTWTDEEIFEAYKLNHELSVEMWRFITHFEILLRNKISNANELAFGDTDWIRNQLRSGYFRRKEAASITKVLSNHRGRNPMTNDLLVSRLSLSFWVRLLNTPYKEITFKNPKLITYVTSISKGGMARSDILNICKSIEKLRNRISHHENILTMVPNVVDRLKEGTLLMNLMNKQYTNDLLTHRIEEIFAEWENLVRKGK
jgi:hypothetical protein